MEDIKKSQDNRNVKTFADNGLAVIATIAVLVFAGFISWFLCKALVFASPAIVPVLLGFFLALFFKPYYQICLKFARNPTVALILMLSSVLIPLSILIWYAGALAADQVSHLIAQGPELFQRVSEWFSTTFPKFNALLDQIGFSNEKLVDVYSRCGVSAIKAGAGALRLAQLIISAIVTLVFFVFFLTTRERHGDEMVKGFVFLKEDTKKFIAEQIDAFTGILVSFFQRQTVICLCEGLLYGTGFAVVGLPCGFLIGFALGVINLVPFLGSLVCLPVALPLAYFGSEGSVLRLFSVLAVWLVGQFLDGYFITPKIQGDRTGLGYAGVIFSFFLWSTLLGPLLGMLLAIPLSAFCVVLWRALKSKYIRPVV